MTRLYDHNAISPRNGIQFGVLLCTVSFQNIQDWLCWMDTIYEQVDAELNSDKDAHAAWNAGIKEFRRYARRAIKSKYKELNGLETVITNLQVSQGVFENSWPWVLEFLIAKNWENNRDPSSH